MADNLLDYNIDIDALSETRFAETGQVQEVGAGYTFFWSNRGKEERREAGVSFAIRSQLVKKLPSLPNSVNDRLITLDLDSPFLERSMCP